MREGVDFPSRAELKKLMDAAPERRRPLLFTAVFTGMRASELRGLTWADVDLEAGAIHVTQRADAWRTIGPPKSKAGRRTIPLTPIVINTLRAWSEQCRRWKERKEDAGELRYVFPNGLGRIESYQNILHRFFEPLQVACGVAVDTGKVDKDGVHLSCALAMAYTPCATRPPACSSPT